MYPILFKLGPLTVYSYGLMVALAFIAGTLLAGRAAHLTGIPKDRVASFSFIILVSGILGARACFVLLNINDFLKNPSEIIMLNHGGLVFYGGVIFAVVSAFVYVRITRCPILDLADLISPFAALGHAIGRIGCFLNGCCFGKPAPAPFGIVLNDGISRYPTQIYSSLALMVLFIFLRILLKRRAFRGQVLFSYLILYSAGRFLMEFLRGDNAPVIFGLTFSQIVSAAAFLAGAAGYLLVKKWARIK